MTLSDTTTRLYDATVSYLEDTRDHFEPLPTESPLQKNVRRKAFGELTMFVHVATVLDGQTVPSSLTSLATDRANDEAYFGQLARKPTRARLYGPPLAYAYARGELDDRPLEILRDTLERGDVWAQERRPSDALDLVHVAQLADGRVAVDAEAAMETAAQRHGLHPVTADLEGVYRLTHEVLFWERVGLSNREPLGASFPTTADDHLRGLLLRFLAEDNLDIALELLLVGVFRGAVSPSTVRLLLEAAATQAADGDGSIRGPDLDDSADIGPGETDETDDETLPPAVAAWKRDYHTTIVGGMTGVVVADQWESFRETTTYDTHDCGLDELAELGEALAALSDYDLQGAATTLQDVADTPVARAFPDVVASAAEFLAGQRRSDGLFGHWTDERALYERRNPDGDFEGALLEPAAEECAAALEAVDYEPEQ